MHLHADEPGAQTVRIVVDHHAHQMPVNTVRGRVAAGDQVDGIPSIGEEAGKFLIVSGVR